MNTIYVTVIEGEPGAGCVCFSYKLEAENLLKAIKLANAKRREDNPDSYKLLNNALLPSDVKKLRRASFACIADELTTYVAGYYEHEVKFATSCVCNPFNGKSVFRL